MGARAEEFLFSRHGLDRGRVERLVGEALRGCDDGEAFFEFRRSESVGLDDGRIRTARFDETSGVGLRAVSGERTGYAHSSEISEGSLRRAGETVRSVLRGGGGGAALAPRRTNARAYGGDDPLEGEGFEDKVALLREMDVYARGRDSRVRQVSASLSGEWQVVGIVRSGGVVFDIRPLVRLSVQVIVEGGGRRESGMSGSGGRYGYGRIIEPGCWRGQVDEALRQALVNLGSVPAPAGEMDVVLGSGWPGILLHEAVGHGLEGDFHRKGTSAFAGLEGKRIASPGVTVVDDGTLPDRRGSLTIDDEGTPASRTVLIEDGILRCCIQDRLNARVMGRAPTGNGRRESYAHVPMPRMTNTFMLNGVHDREEMIGSVKSGIYAPYFGGGQVDITSGKFVFSCTEAYRIENGKIGAPLKGAMLIGNGPDVLTKVKMIGNDMALDPGIGTCGKDGQSVPVGVGQPSLLIAGLTVGGTKT